MILPLLRRSRRKQEPEPSHIAAAQVLSTYELLENILTYLDPRDLRRAREVSKTWQALITRSRPLAKSCKDDPLRSQPRKLRLLLLGLPGSGKKSLMKQWALQAMLDGDAPTLLDARTLSRPVHVDGEHYITTIEVLATDPDDPLLSTRLHHADACALVYSVTSRASLQRAQDLHIRLRALSSSEPDTRTAGLSDPRRDRRRPRPRPVGLIATKCDVQSLLRGWEVPRHDGAALAAKLGCALFETSAAAAGDGADAALRGVVRAYKRARIDDLMSGVAAERRGLAVRGRGRGMGARLRRRIEGSRA